VTTGVAIVGTGHIAASYARSLTARGVRIVACVDIDADRAIAFGMRWRAASVSNLTELTAYSPDVALNLTSVLAHAEVTTKLLELGIPVFSEKPMALDVAAARALVDLSISRRIDLRCAPDTLLGTRQQRLRNALDVGLIGQPMLIIGQIAWSGHERWHPRPQSFYQAGGGPLLDLGPYWIATMVDLVGPVVAVTAARPCHLPAQIGTTDSSAWIGFVPEVPTTVAVILEFASGVMGCLTMSFDWPHTKAPSLEIVGDEGVLACDTPLFNGAGVLRHRLRGSKAWRRWHPHILDHEAAISWYRGIGVVSMINSPEVHETSLDKRLALHTLEILQASSISLNTGKRIVVATPELNLRRRFHHSV